MIRLRAFLQRFVAFGRRLLLLLGLPAVTYGVVMQLEPFSESEESELIEFAIQQAGVDVWYVMGGIYPDTTVAEASAVVVFDPAGSNDSCMARAVHFSARADASGKFVWSPPRESAVSYLLWFSPCDDVDVESAIEVRDLIGFDVLEQIRDESAAILDEIKAILESERPGPDPRLSEIELRYDPNHGPVYTISFEYEFCLWVFAEVVMEADRARVLEVGRGVC